MKKEECFYLGKVTKPFGYKGELVLFLDVDDIDDYRDLKSVFIETNQQLIPFFIQKLSIHNNKVVVSFNNLSPEASLLLIGKSLYLPLSMLPALEGTKFYFHEIIGFKIFDKEKGYIGDVEQVLDYPVQALFLIRWGEKEILIPIIDEIILAVDRKECKIHISAPEGLIDLYLNSEEHQSMMEE